MPGEIRQVFTHQRVHAGVVFGGVPADGGQNVVIHAESDVPHMHSIRVTVTGRQRKRCKTLFQPGFALGGLDEFHAAEAEGRPVLIDGDGSDWFEARLAENLPSGSAIDLATVMPPSPAD